MRIAAWIAAVLVTVMGVWLTVQTLGDVREKRRKAGKGRPTMEGEKKP